MDTPPKTPKAGLEDEKAFSETLLTDHGLTDQPDQPDQPELLPEPARLADADTGTTQPAPLATATQRPWIGKIMGHFKLLRLIGEGTMGLVIQAEDIHLKRIVALKVLRKQLAAAGKGKSAVDQFLREARAAAALEHPNIVRVYEIDQHGGWWYIAMEMITGNSLQEILKAAGALPAARACPIIADVATGLQAAHELGMIHRDIKPSNILVTRNGHGKISDFGLVRVDDPNDPFDTYAHQSVGTPFYIAPEMIRRQTIGPAVDIYSLGATLYHLLTGRPPYTAEKMEDVLRQHLHAEIPNLQQVLPDCSPSLAILVQRMMSKEPHLRPSAAEAAAMLHAESIALFPDAAGISGPGGSSVIVPWQGMPDKTRPPLSDTTILMSDTPLWKRPGYFLTRISTLWRVVLAIVVLLVLGGLAFRLYSIRKPPSQDRRLVSRLFPQAPAGYGTGNTEMMPVPPSLPNEVPGFSWVGKVDASTCRYLASRSGRYFYPIDDKRAVLIRADQFVGYQTAEEALQDGKQPAP